MPSAPSPIYEAEFLTYVATGTQQTYPRENSYIWDVLEAHPVPDLVLTGGCIGVDETVGRFYAENYPKVIQCLVLPAEDYRSKTSYWWYKFQHDGLRDISSWNTGVGLIERNDKMVEEASKYEHPHGLGFPKERTEQRRSGTWATIRRFRKYNVPYETFPLCDAPRS